MNLFYKVALPCLILCISHLSSAQCLTAKRIESTSGDSILYSCPGGNKDLVSIKQFAYNTPFVFVITDTKDTVLRLANTGIVSFEGLPTGEYRVYGFAYKGPLNRIKGLHLHSSKIANFCFAKSLNYITVMRETPMAPVIGAQAMQPVFFCAPDSKADSIVVNAVFPSNTIQKFLVVDESERIIYVSSSKTVAVENLKCATCHIYALSHSGQYIAPLNAKLNSKLADDCYALSPDHILLSRGVPKAGLISFADSTDSQFVCATSSKLTTMDLRVKGLVLGKLAYVVSNSQDTILDILTAPILNLGQLPRGTCRIRSVAYTGILSTFKSGQHLNQFALSNDCYSLSDNFINLQKEIPAAGLIRAAEDEYLICNEDTSVIIRPTIVGQVVTSSILLITDTSNNVLFSLPTAAFKPSNWPKGLYRVYHLAYTGSLVFRADLKITDVLSDDCYDVSKNYLAVTVDEPIVGTLQFADQSRNAYVCSNDPKGLKLAFIHKGYSLLNKAYVLTDSSDRFIATSFSTEFDLSSLTNGMYKIYATSYIGDLDLVAGKSILAASSSKGCLKVSASPLLITKSDASISNILFLNNQDTLLLCKKTTPKFVRLKSLTPITSLFKYIEVNEANTVVRILNGDSIVLDDMSIGTHRFYGLAYTGTLRLTPGQSFLQDSISTGCAQRSRNSAVLILDTAAGGSIQLHGEQTNYTVCQKDGWPDVLDVRTSSASQFIYQYVATDSNDFIVSLNVTNLNLELLPIDVTYIYGISYSGSVLARLGEPLHQTVFSDDCYEISQNKIRLSFEEVLAGSLRSNAADNNFNFCLASNTVDTIKLTVTGHTPGKKYLFIGIQKDTIRMVSSQNLFLSTDFVKGTTQLYGIAYTGRFNARVGDKLSASRLTDSCYGVSVNSIVVHRGDPEAGVITNGTGQPVFYLCPRDGQSDFINLEAIDASSLPYAYLITTENDSIVAVSTSAVVDLDSFPQGICKIYGLSYKGTIKAIRKHIKASDLVSECFDVTDNFISVHKAPAQGGRLSLANGDTAVTICVEDLGSDTLRFLSTTGSAFKYALLMTDEQNRLQFIFNDLSQAQEFNGFDPGTSRMYGIAYGGILTAFRNDDVLKARLATGCFDLSDNFVRIQKLNSGGLCKNIGVNEENTAFISTYPNPTRDEVAVSIKSKFLKSGKPELYLLGADGVLSKKIILNTQNIDNQIIKINVSNLNPGFYFLMFKNGYIFDRIKFIVIR